MMKIIFYISGFMLMLMTINTNAADSKITIDGTVIDNGCTIESKDFWVDLQSNSSKQFSTIGSTTPYIPFNIVLSPCGDAATAVKVAFAGVSDNSNTSLLKLDDSASTAAGLGIQILDSNKTPMAINAPMELSGWLPLKAGETNILNFYSRLMATQVPITSGHVEATATFTLEFQ